MKQTLERGHARKLKAGVFLAPLAAVCLGALQSPTANAQAAPDNKSVASDPIDTVIITANKRTQALEDVPASITVISEDDLRRSSADSIETLANAIPGLQLQSFGPGQTRITIRGVSPDEQTGVSTVGYYIDEIPIMAPDQRSQPEVWLYDVDRVEVLRGPQGTLYGEGAMGGAVRIITKKPDTSAFAASVRGGLYSVEDGEIGHKVNGMVNVPIIKDMLAGRVVVESRYNAGWIDTTLLTIPVPTATPPGRYVVSSVQEDANNSEDTSVRAMLRFTPTDKLTVDATYISGDIDTNTTNIGTVDATHNRDLGLRPRTDKSEMWNLTAAYDFDSFSVTSASSYVERERAWSLAQEPILLGSTALAQYIQNATAEGEAFTQEIRAVSDATGPFRWTVGAYYRNSFESSLTRAVGFVPASTTSVPLFGFGGTSHYRSQAIFGQAEYDITDALTLIGGGRWFKETENVGTTERDADGFSPLATIQYRIAPGFQAYGTYSEGYRSGGFNFSAGPPTYDPDTTKNYEVGFKYISPDNALSLDASAYFVDWSDMQFTQIDTGGFFTFVGNANKASSRGIDFMGQYNWNNGFWARANVSLTDAHLDSPVVANLGGDTSDGTALPSTPDYKANLTVGYSTMVMNDIGMELTADWSFVGSQDTKLEKGGSFTLPAYGTFIIGTPIDAYNTANARAEFTKDNYALAFYVRNLFNSDEPIGNDNFFPALGQPLHYVTPRTIGVEVSAAW
ncbi:MAG TPA: TonB-dependent receptor [Hyphomonadaceae bacterium]|nr:TonB-dependent receptor [Hyphomonadaceae bacterium]HPN04190.1 TonB-dependent receptor [Hyphomonadaceae bacterium]